MDGIEYDRDNLTQKFTFEISDSLCVIFKIGNDLVYVCFVDLSIFFLVAWRFLL